MDAQKRTQKQIRTLYVVQKYEQERVTFSIQPSARAAFAFRKLAVTQAKTLYVL